MKVYLPQRHVGDGGRERSQRRDAVDAIPATQCGIKNLMSNWDLCRCNFLSLFSLKLRSFVFLQEGRRVFSRPGFPGSGGGGVCWGCDRPTGRSISRLMWVPLAAAEENPSADSLLLPGIPKSTSWNNSALAAALVRDCASSQLKSEFRQCFCSAPEILLTELCKYPHCHFLNFFID